MSVEIWILDDDITHSFEIKARIKEYLKDKTDKINFEVFHATTDLVACWQLAAKNKKNKPQLSVLEMLIQQQNIFELIPRDFFEGAKILVCSSASYGGYKNYCLSKALTEFPFIEKMQVDHKLNKFLDDFLKDQKGFDAQLKKKLGICLQKIKNLEDIYYNTAGLELPLEQIFELVNKILQETSKYKCVAPEKASANFMELKDKKEVKSLRLKKDLRDLLLVYSGFKQKYKLE